MNTETIEWPSSLVFPGGDHKPKEPTVDSLTETAQAWMTLSLDDQTTASIALLDHELEEAKQQIMRARNKLEQAQIAINDACALKRRSR